ncbi:unnamed protein product [Prunus armeniaca]
MDKNILLEICKNSSFRLFLISSIVCRSNTKNGGNFSLAPLYRCYYSFHCDFDGIFVLLLFPPLQIVTDCIVQRVHPATQIRKIKRMNQLSCSIAATGPIEGMRLARKIVTDCIVHRVHPAFQFKKFKMNPVNQIK